jgi:PAS domain S-box-containing protein
VPYESYFRAATEGLIIVDRGGHIVELNSRAEQLFGYSEEELRGQPIEILVPPQLREIHASRVRGYFAAPRTRSMGIGLSLAGRRKDGSEFPIEIGLTYSSKTTSRGDLVVAAVTDISQRLALEGEARRAETIISLGTFAAGIAHDLNNPLQVIRSRAELVLESPVSTPASELYEDLATIHRQAERATRIIEGFLELSRQREKAVAPLDINQLVDNTLLLLGEQMRNADIRLRTELDRSLPQVNGDMTALERVLVNLLSNARDAMPEGGAITIVSGQPDETPGWLHLTIADNGPGIAPDVLKKIFDLLYTTKASGTGLGLWMSRRIIQEHNGRIDVQSELGRGTRFTINLPTVDSSSS